MQRLGDLSLSRRTGAWSNWRVVLGSTGSGMRLSACWGWITGICHLFLACLQVCWLPLFPNTHASWVSCPSTHYLFTLIPGSDNIHAHALTLPWIQTHFHTPPPQFTSPDPHEPSLSLNTNSCIHQSPLLASTLCLHREKHIPTSLLFFPLLSLPLLLQHQSPVRVQS